VDPILSTGEKKGTIAVAAKALEGYWVEDAEVESYISTSVAITQ
jgi:hypothetical protein